MFLVVVILYGICSSDGDGRLEWHVHVLSGWLVATGTRVLKPVGEAGEAYRLSPPLSVTHSKYREHLSEHLEMTGIFHTCYSYS